MIRRPQKQEKHAVPHIALQQAVSVLLPNVTPRDIALAMREVEYLSKNAASDQKEITHKGASIPKGWLGHGQIRHSRQNAFFSLLADLGDSYSRIHSIAEFLTQIIKEPVNIPVHDENWIQQSTTGKYRENRQGAAAIRALELLESTYVSRSIKDKTLKVAGFKFPVDKVDFLIGKSADMRAVSNFAAAYFSLQFAVHKDCERSFNSLVEKLAEDRLATFPKNDGAIKNRSR